MREILFKGFFEYDGGKESIRVNGEIVTGEWAVGLLTSVESNVSTSRISPITFNESGEIVYLSQNSWAHDDVIPETVCEYTGLKDKNGRMIFEGDTARAYRGVDYFTGEVYYDERAACFGIRNCSDCILFVDFFIGKNKNESLFIEVIGTIFDVKEESK